MAERKRFLDNPAHVRWLFIAFCIVCGIVLGLDFLRNRALDNYSGGWAPGYYCLYAGIGVTLLVFASKLLRKLVKRPEDYYDE